VPYVKACAGSVPRYRTVLVRRELRLGLEWSGQVRCEDVLSIFVLCLNVSGRCGRKPGVVCAYPVRAYVCVCVCVCVCLPKFGLGQDQHKDMHAWLRVHVFMITAYEISIGSASSACRRLLESP
jgi:hypothetical protein